MAHAHPAHLPRPHDLFDAAVQLGRRDDGRDPQHPRGLRHSPGVRHGPLPPRADRSDAPRLHGSEPLARRPRFRHDAARSPAVEVVRGGEAMHTTHYSIVDQQGNAASVTTTLNGGFGSGVTVTGAGFLLNNEMDDFATAPGKPNMYGLVQGEANAVAGNKRMLSAMTPSIVLDSAGNLEMVVGTPGGPTIITSVAQVILNVLDQKMSLADAVAAPRIHHQALPEQTYYEH